jgi:hypothetical protein
VQTVTLKTSCRYPLQAEDSKWTDWPGKWGDDSSPESPGQQPRYKCPWKWYEREATACPSRAKISQASAREAVASACGNWFGGSIVATVCSPSVLLGAIHRAQMDGHGTIHIRLGNRIGRSGSRPGVAQASGAPLAPGESLVVDGNAPDDTTLLVRAQASGHLIEAAFSHLDLAHGGRGGVKALRAHTGVRLIWIGRDGRSVAPTKVRAGRAARRVHIQRLAPHIAHSASSHSVVRSVAEPSHTVERACQKTAASDGHALIALKSLVGRKRHTPTTWAKIHALHEKLAYRKC